MAKRGGFPGMGGNMNNLMKQAQKMQKQMEETTKQLEETEYCLLYNLRAHETKANLVCRLLLEKKKDEVTQDISLIHIDKPTRLSRTQYDVY